MKILIAEDDIYSGKLLRKILEDLGHQTLLAEDGLKAWELFQERGIRMIITDWMMPQMDGLTLCRKIRSSGKESYTYIIFLTAKDQKQDLIAVFEAGADDYIKKPFDPEEIRARIKTGERIVKLEEGHKELEQILVESRNKLKVAFDNTLQQKRILERVNKELQDALDNIQELEGIVPICAHCKKIRDSGDEWQKLEAYIEEHSEAQFSHGICPDCKEQFYPELHGK